MRILCKKMLMVVLPVAIGGCTMTSVATTNAKGHSVRLSAALCEDGAPAVSILGARPKQTGRSQEFTAPLPKTIFLRPGMYVIAGKCERNRSSCGGADDRNWPTRGPRMLMTYLAAGERKALDCESKTGEIFVFGENADESSADALFKTKSAPPSIESK